MHGTFRYYQDQIDILPVLSARCTLAMIVLEWQFSIFSSCLGRQPARTVEFHDGKPPFVVDHSPVPLVVHTLKSGVASSVTHPYP